jgi:hypothetical protein
LDEKVDLKFFVQFAVRFFVLLPECATWTL